VFRIWRRRNSEDGTLSAQSRLATISFRAEGSGETLMVRNPAGNAAAMLRFAPLRVLSSGALKKMQNVHQLIAHFGLDSARKRAASKADRSCIEAAAALLDAGPCTKEDIGYAVLGSSCLPHKNLDRSATPDYWQSKIDNVTLAIDSGHYPDGTPIGIPFGSKARIILVYLTTAAVAATSPEIELGASMYAWLHAMSSGKFGGMTYRLFGEQARRIAAMTVHANVDDGAHSLALSGHSIAELIRPDGSPDATPPYLLPRGETEFPQRVLLDRGYWSAAKTHSCAIRLCALGQLGNNSTAIDLYVWLAHHLPPLQYSQTVSWAELHVMFGSGYRHLRQMKAPFLNALGLALAVYPEAHVEAGDAGVSLFPSPSPVPAAE
jgi:hypothetical protein